MYLVFTAVCQSFCPVFVLQTFYAIMVRQTDFKFLEQLYDNALQIQYDDFYVLSTCVNVLIFFICEVLLTDYTRSDNCTKSLRVPEENLIIAFINVRQIDFPVWLLCPGKFQLTEIGLLLQSKLSSTPLPPSRSQYQLLVLQKSYVQRESLDQVPSSLG